MDLKLRKRCACGYLNVIRVDWLTAGGQLDVSCPACGRRMTFSAWNGIYGEHKRKELTDAERAR